MGDSRPQPQPQPQPQVQLQRGSQPPTQPQQSQPQPQPQSQAQPPSQTQPQPQAPLPKPSARVRQRRPRRTPAPAAAPAPAAPAAQPPPARDDHSADDACKIYVTGFPPYTQQQDLTRTFSKFGTMKVEKLTSKFATLSFPNTLDAKTAIQNSRKMSIYGEVITVKEYNAKLVETKPKREFTRSEIIDPKDIDLSGDFYKQVEQILTTICLTQEEVRTLCTLYRDVETALQLYWPGCRAVPFGSITTGLGIRSSDADCFVELPAQLRPAHAHPHPHAHAHATFVNKAKRLLQQRPDRFAEIIAIPRANTPIVKFFHAPTETNCDLTFKTPLGVRNSKLIAFLLHLDRRAIPMSVVVKYWAKVHGFSGTGKLTNYTLTWLIIFYLQRPPRPVLPPVHWLQRTRPEPCLVDHWDTGFVDEKDALPPSSNAASLSELLGEFFVFYSKFNFDEMVVCPYLGVPVKKETFKDPSQLPPEFERYKDNVVKGYTMPIRVTTAMCVQDPFEQCHNVASAIGGKMAADIKAFFNFAATAYDKDKRNDCKDFLKIILFQKPKIIRERNHPEYRINLFPKIITNIIETDWKSVVREATLTIFEKILKLKMGKMEEKVNPHSKKEKEKYTSNVTSAIWKRKQFTKLYSFVKMEFLQKETRITEEILNVEKHQINIQFQLTMVFGDDPRSAVVFIKLTNGEHEAFKEFGKFFVSVITHWFVHLLKPHTTSTAAKVEETVKNLDSNLDNSTETNNALDSDDDDSLNVNVTDSTNGECDISVSVDENSADTISNNEESFSEPKASPTATGNKMAVHPQNSVINNVCLNTT